MTLIESRTAKGRVLTIITLFMLVMFLLPFFYGVSSSFKSKEQLSSLNQSPIPMSPKKYKYNGKDCEILLVPMDDGTKKALAVIKKGRDSSVFIDPEKPGGGEIVWQGKWRSLEKVWETDFQFINYKKGWDAVNFLRLFKNTLFYALITTFGTLLSSTVVAYGFSRFRFPGKKQFFMILIATIVLPGAVTLIPLYTIFYKIGWVGTWLPLVVPHFFCKCL